MVVLAVVLAVVLEVVLAVVGVLAIVKGSELPPAGHSAQAMF